MPLTTDHVFLEYLTNVSRYQESGNLGLYPDPALPADFGAPLTQDEINFLKIFIKEVQERFTSPEL